MIDQCEVTVGTADDYGLPGRFPLMSSDCSVGMSYGLSLQHATELADATDRLAAADRLGARPCLGTTATGMATVG